ncbi:MAG: hypothetical protein F4Z59_03995 [Gemmatimonadales bacterium]|nr:hypothetical protein [Gemmatimonadales bacterium]
MAKGIHGLVIERGLPVLATADKGGRGCEILSGIIDESFRTYRGGEGGVSHLQCEATGADHCLWVLEPTAGEKPEKEESTAVDAVAG